MVLDLFRIGCFSLLASMAGTALAQETTYGARTSCHQTCSAAISACNSSINNYLNDNDVTSAQCSNCLGGTCLYLTIGGTSFLGGIFACEAAGAGYCSAEFQEERTNAQEISNLATSINNLDVYTQTQLTTVNQNFGDIDADLQVIDQTLQTFAADIGANTVSAAAHETRLNGIDTALVTIDGELTDLANTDALIASDIGALQLGQGNLIAGVGTNASNIGVNASKIASNELYIESVELQQSSFEAASTASSAATNDYLTLQQLPVLQSIQLESAQTNAGLGTLAAKFDESNQTFNNVALQQVAGNQTGLESKSLLQSIDGKFAADSVLQANMNAIADLTLPKLDNISNNQGVLAGKIDQTNTALVSVENAINGISLDISGENISMDNSGVENRLDAILTEVSTVPVSQTQVTDTVSDSQSETYNSIQGVPVIQAFTGLSNIWTGTVNDFT